jgi:hypothetical protein
MEVMNLNLFLCYLAQGGATAPPQDLARGGNLFTALKGETGLILGLAVALGLGLFAWALFVRKRRPSDLHRRVIEPGSTADGGEPAQDKQGHHSHRRRRHRHRHRHGSHTHRNPTLQETGGLPAPRADDQLPAA